MKMKNEKCKMLLLIFIYSVTLRETTFMMKKY